MQSFSKTHRISLLFLLALLLAVNPLLAQVRQQAPAKGIEVESNADVLSVQIYKSVKEAGRIIKLDTDINHVDPTLSFRSGELISVAYSVNFDGYVYFINVGPEGTRVIYPTMVANVAPTPANLQREVALRLNNNVGREELVLVVSRERLARLDAAISRTDKMLDTQTTDLPANQGEYYQPNVVAAAYRPLKTQGDAGAQYQSSTQRQNFASAQPQQLASVEQATAPKKTSKWKTVGIVAGGIGLSILGAWVGMRFGAPGVGNLINNASAQMGMPAAAPTGPDPNLMPSTAPISPIPADEAAGTPMVPVSRGLEVETDTTNTIRAYPMAADNGSLRLQAGQVASFRISFDHR